MFDVARSCLYAHRERVRHIDVERMALRSRVHELFVESRSSAGSRSIMDMMREEGTAIGRFKVSRLIAELGWAASNLASTPTSKPRWSVSTFRIISTESSRLGRQITSGAATSLMFGRRGDGITWLWCWICSLAERWAGHSRYGPTPTLLCKRWKWLSSSVVDRRDCCSIRIRIVSTPAENSVSACGATGYGRV